MGVDMLAFYNLFKEGNSLVFGNPPLNTGLWLFQPANAHALDPPPPTRSARQAEAFQTQAHFE